MQILTVIYHETYEHYLMALKTWNSFPKTWPITAVINRKTQDHYPSEIKYIQNTENCLAKAWNTGLKEIFKTEDIALVSGLDSIAPKMEEIEFMESELKLHPEYGIISATSDKGTFDIRDDSIVDIQHGDGSFSFFLITKEAFDKVGDFNELFKPAYFEDNNYLERLWEAGYKPKRCCGIKFLHVTQGTVKYGTEIKKQYPVFMQRNLELFKKIHGKVPDHLPSNIRFN